MNEDLKNEIESVVENLSLIVEAGDACSESILHFVEGETKDLQKRYPNVSGIKAAIEEGLEENGII